MITIGCESPPPGLTDPDESQLTSVDGLQLSITTQRGRGGQSEISAQKAEKLALAWLNDFGILTKDYWEQQRQSPINWPSLASCGTPLYATSPVDASNTALPRSVQRSIGAWWIVLICGTSGPEMSVAVSARNTDLEVSSGHLSLHRKGGVRFIPRAIPETPEYSDNLVLSPQRALEMVREATKVSPTGEVEMIYQPGVMPQYAYWRVKLKRPVELVTETGFSLKALEVFAGAYRPKTNGTVTVPSPEGRREYVLNFLGPDNAENHAMVPVRPSYAVDRVEVRLPGEPNN